MEQNRDHHIGASAEISLWPLSPIRLEYRPPLQAIDFEAALIDGAMDMFVHSNIHTPLCADVIPVGPNRDRSICNSAGSVGLPIDLEVAQSQS